MPRKNLDPRYSSFYSEQESIVNFQYYTVLEDSETGASDYHIDALNHNLLSRINSITEFSWYRWTDEKPFTTVIFEFYGTTSLWWFVLLYNGLMHPLEIEPGVLLKMPAKQEMDKVVRELQQARPDTRGQTIRI